MKRAFFWVMLIAVSLFFSASNVFAADGWAGMNGDTTGGAGGTVVTVDNFTDLEYYAEIDDTPYIIQVSGTIDIGGDGFDIHSNKTIIGLGTNATLIGNVGFNNSNENIILERLNITNPYTTGAEDGASIKDDIKNVLITKCTIYHCLDGLLDITNNSDYVTVSWCKFYYTSNTGHNFPCLVGSSDSHTDDANNLRITFHHNWWAVLCKERMPRVRYGQVHVYNNYYSNLISGGYCIGVGCGARIRVENNYFNAVPNPWKDYYSGNPAYPPGHIGWNTGNVFHSCSQPTWATNEYSTIFTPPYSYTMDDGEDIPDIVQAYAGAGTPYPPHWFVTVYGDFDRNDIVDMNDLETFADYWLDTNDINDADYDYDGIVNGYEFTLFAGNWLKMPPDTTAPDTPENLWALAGDGTVSLEWADNDEPDFNGYNLYRSTTSGDDYTKLNDPLLTGSNYIDNTVSNGTMYYYAVKAVDTSENESGASVEACAVPSVEGNSITIQEIATGFCGLEGDIENEHTGHTGWGYANTDNASGNGVDWRINVNSSGIYTFKWRYANASSNRPADLLVNGSPAASDINFPGTGAWTSWSDVLVDVDFITTAVKDVRLEATGAEGLANIDCLMVIGTAPEVASCP